MAKKQLSEDGTGIFTNPPTRRITLSQIEAVQHDPRALAKLAKGIGIPNTPAINEIALLENRLKDLPNLKNLSEDEISRVKKASKEALFFLLASRDALNRCDINQVFKFAVRAGMSCMETGVRMVEPLAKAGRGWVERQSKTGFLRYKEQQQKHVDWQKHQKSEITNAPMFEKLSKTEQARQIKKKFKIKENVSTIAKRLVPLPKK